MKHLIFLFLLSLSTTAFAETKVTAQEGIPFTRVLVSSTAGNYTWTVPVGVSIFKVYCTGGGGGGSNATAGSGSSGVVIIEY